MEDEILSESDKNRIRAEEIYRASLKDRNNKPKTFFQRLDDPIKLLQLLTIAIGIFGTLWQYKSNSRKERLEAAREYQKSFYQAQMAVYAEAVNATSVLATAEPLSDDYNQSRQKFLQLFWGRMSMFENKSVEQKMVDFRKLMLKFEQKDYQPVEFYDALTKQREVYDTVSQVVLKMASLRLAHECRLYTIKTWLPEEERLFYNLEDSASYRAR